MAKQMHKLDRTAMFPALTLNIAGASAVTLPTDIQTPYAVLLFYRGHW